MLGAAEQTSRDVVSHPSELRLPDFRFRHEVGHEGCVLRLDGHDGGVHRRAVGAAQHLRLRS